MEKTFTFAGVSRLKGEFKVRFANDVMRVKVLAKGGHTDIDIIEMPNAMTKQEVIDFLVKIDFANGNMEVQAAIEEAQAKRAEPEVKEAKPRKAKAPKEVVTEQADPGVEDVPQGTEDNPIEWSIMG